VYPSDTVVITAIPFPRTAEGELSDIIEQRDMTTKDSEIEIGLAEASDLPELLGLYRFLPRT
jgi:hypothetical protein